MYLIYAIATTVFWGFTDMFAKKGTDENDRSSHLKMVVMVGTTMGLSSLFFLMKINFDYSLINIIRYLPVSFFYILSMTIGYVGLRYLAVSVLSPVQNSSGAITALLLFIFTKQTMDGVTFAAVIIISAGILFLAYVEKTKEEVKNTDKKKIGVIALIFPLLYCVIDSMGTYADSLILDGEVPAMDEDTALISYLLTFFICAVLTFLYLFIIKKEKLTFRSERYKGVSALFETAGEVTYIYALADNSIVAAPLISAYCMFSVMFSRIFIKEKLSAKHYAAITVIITGILLLAVWEVL